MKRFHVRTDARVSKLNLGKVQIVASLHAKERASERGVWIPAVLDIKEGSIVELEIEGKVLGKLVVRTPSYTRHHYDDVFVLVPRYGKYHVLTTYQNHITDEHVTLNMERF